MQMSLNILCLHIFFWIRCNVTPSPPPHYLSLLTVPLLTAGDQLVVEGVTHISCHHTRIRSGGQEKIKQTNKHEQSLGLTQEQKKSYATLCIPDSIYGLTLAWVTSENSTKQLECRHLDSSSSLDPILSATGLRSPVLTAPVRGSTPTLFARLCCPAPTASLLRCPVNSPSRPLTTSGYGEISCPRILCLVSRQNRQRNRLLWRSTHIVLHRLNSRITFIVFGGIDLCIVHSCMYP